MVSPDVGGVARACTNEVARAKSTRARANPTNTPAGVAWNPRAPNPDGPYGATPSTSRRLRVFYVINIISPSGEEPAPGATAMAMPPTAQRKARALICAETNL